MSAGVHERVGLEGSSGNGVSSDLGGEVVSNAFGAGKCPRGESKQSQTFRRVLDAW